MDLSALRTEVTARGFDFDSATRIDRWINTAYQRICERQAWPFLESEATGSSPLLISDLRAVLSIVDTTTNGLIEYEDIRDIRERDPAYASTTGTPTSWYLNGSALTVYPANTTDSLLVRYLKVPTDLSADDDEPLIPDRFRYVIVDGAVVYAYRDTDNYDAAGATADIFEQGIAEMAMSLLVSNYDTPTQIASGYMSSTDW